MSDDEKGSGPRSSMVTYVRRGSSLRTRAPSSMPVDGSNLHSLYIAVANLQMSKSRQEKIRQALLRQVQQTDDAIAQANLEISELEDQIQALEASKRPSRASKERRRAGGQEAPEGDDSKEDGFVFDY